MKVNKLLLLESVYRFINKFIIIEMQLLYYSSYLGFILVFTSIYYSFILYAIIYLTGTLTSLNYWKDPTSYMNRYIDIMCIWFLAIYFTYLAFINNIYTYLYYVILESTLYILELIIEKTLLMKTDKYIANLPNKIHFLLHLLCIPYNVYLLDKLYLIATIK